MTYQFLFKLVLLNGVLIACSGGESDTVDPATSGSAGQAVAGAGQGGGGQPDGGQPGGGQPGGGATTAGEANAGAGGSSGAGDQSGNGGSETAGPRGRIQLISLYGQTIHRLSASFSLPEELPANPPANFACTTQTSGACSLHTCEPSSAPGGPVVPVAQPHAGSITFVATDLDDPTRVVTASAMPDSLGSYAPADLSNTLLGRETLRFDAEGGEVPAFSFETQSPLRLLLTNLDVVVAADQATLSISTATDTVLSWERGAAGVSFFAQGTSSTQSMLCQFDSLAGTGTIPADLAGQAGGMELLFTTLTSESFDAGDYSVNVVAAYDVMTPDRSAAVVGVVQ